MCLWPCLYSDCVVLCVCMFVNVCLYCDVVVFVCVSGNVFCGDCVCLRECMHVCECVCLYCECVVFVCVSCHVSMVIVCVFALVYACL